MLKASHLAPTLFVTMLATLLAVAAGQTPWGVALVVATVLTGQLSIGWSNDWLDATRDSLSGRTDKPIVVGSVSAVRVRGAAFGALAASVPLSFANGLGAGAAHLGLVGSGWAYNLGLKATWWSWAPYAVGFGLLPAFVTLGLPTPLWPPWWAMLAGALLGVGAHFGNVLPDIDDDLAHGVRGLPQRMGRTGAGVTALALLLSASLVLLVSPSGAPSRAAWVGVVVVAVLALYGARALRPGRDVSVVFRTAMAIALVDVVLVVDAVSTLTT